MYGEASNGKLADVLLRDAIIVLHGKGEVPLVARELTGKSLKDEAAMVSSIMRSLMRMYRLCASYHESYETMYRKACIITYVITLTCIMCMSKRFCAFNFAPNVYRCL